jgi:hypothetical protein
MKFIKRIFKSCLDNTLQFVDTISTHYKTLIVMTLASVGAIGKLLATGMNPFLATTLGVAGIITLCM